jgi:hypothetical protein
MLRLMLEISGLSEAQSAGSNGSHCSEWLRKGLSYLLLLLNDI